VRRVVAFGLFWWDFVVGDDWLSAAGVAAAIGVTAALAAHGITAWWVLALAVPAILFVTLRRGIER
jgi:hypothetical protein